MTDIDVPTSALAEFIADLARQDSLRHVRSGVDDLADVITRLSDNVVVSDDTDNLIVAQKRAQVIDALTMITLLANYLDEKGAVENQVFTAPSVHVAQLFRANRVVNERSNRSLDKPVCS